MRGFLSLEPDSATQARLIEAQNRLRDALSRQGVSFPDRLGATLFAWPFATLEELDEAANLLQPPSHFTFLLDAVQGIPNGDRPAEVAAPLLGAEPLQAGLFAQVRGPLDPDPPKPAMIRLARISPPSRKVGAALRGAALPDLRNVPFGAESLAIWHQTPQGFEVYRRMRFRDGGP